MRVFTHFSAAIFSASPVADETEGFGDLRLVGPESSDGRGRLEVSIGGEWGSVFGEEFGQLSALVACRQLGFAAAVDFTPGRWAERD